MKSWFRALGVSALAFGFGAPAFADEPAPGFYLDIAVNYMIFDDSDLGGGSELSADDGSAASVAFGYRYDPQFRTELQFVYGRNEFEALAGGGALFGTQISADPSLDGDIRTASLLLNLYYDVTVDTRWTPYLGVGFGGARVEIESLGLGLDDSETVFAVQGLAGVTYRISRNVWARGGYRFFVTGEPTFAGTDVEYLSHNIELGLVIGFDAF
ncbi:MAG: porin family protein [Alphaproteobacteria bacterium]